MSNLLTLTGLTLAEAVVKLDEELPPDAYSKVPGAVDLTDIDPGYMRRVLNTIFGLCGLGWGYDYAVTDLEVAFGEKLVSAVLKRLTFWYTLTAPDGTERRFTIMATGASENRTPQYAMKGALTNALGNAVSNLGFQESVYLGHRSHSTVGKKPTATATTSVVKPAPVAPKPTPTDSSTPTPSTDSGAYVIQIGTANKGKTVAQLTPKDVVWFAEKMAATTPLAQAAKDACIAYLNTHPEVRAQALAVGNGAKAPVA